VLFDDMRQLPELLAGPAGTNRRRRNA